jgi:ketosteroid isomerase-like protein
MRGTMINQDSVANAKAVVASHERYAAAGDLAGIMSNGTEDVVMMVPGVPLLMEVKG